MLTKRIDAKQANEIYLNAETGINRWDLHINVQLGEQLLTGFLMNHDNKWYVIEEELRTHGEQLPFYLDGLTREQVFNVFEDFQIKFKVGLNVGIKKAKSELRDWLNH